MRRRAFVGLSLAVILAALAQDAAGGALRCRSDPAVLLSNGAIVDLSADIDSLLWDIERVDYTMHIPAGLSVVAVVRTPTWPTTKETFNVVADQAPGVYDTRTLVRTKKAGVAVTANLIVKTLTNILGLRSQDGKSGEVIRVGMSVR
jgi:hypothetical protein